MVGDAATGDACSAIARCLIRQCDTRAGVGYWIAEVLLTRGRLWARTGRSNADVILAFIDEGAGIVVVAGCAVGFCWIAANAGITSAVVVLVFLVWIWKPRAIVGGIVYSIVVVVDVAKVALALHIGIGLVWIGGIWAIVLGQRNAVAVVVANAVGAGIGSKAIGIRGARGEALVHAAGIRSAINGHCGDARALAVTRGGGRGLAWGAGCGGAFRASGESLARACAIAYARGCARGHGGGGAIVVGVGVNFDGFAGAIHAKPFFGSGARDTRAIAKRVTAETFDAEIAGAFGCTCTRQTIPFGAE